MCAAKNNHEFAGQILAIVEEIPFGKVATYGQIARLAGFDKNSRLVGKVLCQSEYYGEFPCHRVVNSNGRCAPNWREQPQLLSNENVSFKPNGLVDLRNHLWEM